MSKILTVCLIPEQEEQLKEIRDTDKRPYMRERATAVLKVASGISCHQVALHGLLKPRDPDTVYDWIHSYQAEGLSVFSAALPV